MRRKFLLCLALFTGAIGSSHSMNAQPNGEEIAKWEARVRTGPLEELVPIMAVETWPQRWLPLARTSEGIDVLPVGRFAEEVAGGSLWPD